MARQDGTRLIHRHTDVTRPAEAKPRAGRSATPGAKPAAKRAAAAVATLARPDPARALSHDCKRVSQVLSRIGDKWTVLVVMLLARGPRRFGELKRDIGGVSQRMLTLTLRGLERDGIVTRTVFPTIPPRVDYELTFLGHTLREPVEELGSWAFANLDAIDRSRTDFDARSVAGVEAGRTVRRASGA